jgi:hypothetical protein
MLGFGKEEPAADLGKALTSAAAGVQFRAGGGAVSAGALAGVVVAFTAKFGVNASALSPGKLLKQTVVHLSGAGGADLKVYLETFNDIDAKLQRLQRQATGKGSNSSQMDELRTTMVDGRSSVLVAMLSVGNAVCTLAADGARMTDNHAHRVTLAFNTKNCSGHFAVDHEMRSAAAMQYEPEDVDADADADAGRAAADVSAASFGADDVVQVGSSNTADGLLAFPFKGGLQGLAISAYDPSPTFEHDPVAADGTLLAGTALSKAHT